MSQLKLAVLDERGRPLRIAPGHIQVADGAHVAAPFAEVVREAGARDDFAPLRMRAALLTLLSGALRQSHHGADGPTLDARQGERIAQFAGRRTAERVAPAQIAHLLGLNPDYFTRLFTSTYGMPPRRWILRERMRVAAELLRAGDAPISEVARQLGYADVFLFSRQFTLAHGRSPRALRKDGA